MMLVAFWRTLLKIVVVFQHKRQRNKSFSRFVDNLKTPTRACSARAALQYANELLVRIRLPFKNICKVAKRAETTKNYQNRFYHGEGGGLIIFGKLTN